METGTRTGLYFGITSAVITTAGLLVGLSAGTQSLAPVLGGILVIAIADSMADALGIHLAEEADPGASSHQVWQATLVTFASKLFVATSFAIPLLLFPLQTAVMLALAWGLLLLVLLSWQLARSQGAKPWPVIAEHVVIAVAVVAIAHGVGSWVNYTFNT